ncbi:hypothetical protein EV424DRAFT_1383889 [Suillus variegatus]|nr:hypothetical protein EV424DRAFT_1383889 [Suillus variegatus]
MTQTLGSTPATAMKYTRQQQLSVSAFQVISGCILMVLRNYPIAGHGMDWMAMFIYELLIFVLTVFRTWKTRGLRFSLLSRRDILDVIFQDGVMYFVGMTLVNLPNILTHLCGSEIIRGSLSVFTTCMSVTLISRLMLNLHGCVDTGVFSTPAETSPDVLTTRVDVEFAVSSDHW